MLPLQASAACFKKGSPRPTFRVVRLVKNGSTTRATVASSIPIPSSITLISSLSAILFSFTEMVMFWALAATLFSAMSNRCKASSLTLIH